MTSNTIPVSSASAGEYLTFRLGPEEYGIPILQVQEIRGYSEPTRIANAPGHLKGVLNLRGEIVPILDLRLKLRLDCAPYNNLTVTIVLNIGAQVVGVVVDSVSDVVAVEREQLRSVPDFHSNIDAAFVNGIATIQQGDQQRMLILMDIERLLSSDELGLVPPVERLAA